MNTRIAVYATIALLLFSMISCSEEEGIIDNSNNPILLDCLHSSDITLTNQNENGVDYIVDCDLEIQDGIFRIEPGTTIEFREGSSIEVRGDGILRALGASGSPITMTGTDAGRASWRGIFINSDAGLNQLEHVTIQDAGDGEVFGQFTNNHAAVTFQGRLSMSNCSIINSGDIGVLSEENLSMSSIGVFENNSISGSSRFPILVNQDLISQMDLPSCSFSENGNNMVGMHQESNERLNNSTTLEALDIPYFIESGIELFAPLTIEAGVDIVMGNGSFINATIDLNQFILIQGTQSNHVTIRGQQAISGFWQGIYYNQQNAQNIWEFLDISDGGSTVQGFNDTPANITLEGEANLILNNCTSARSGGSCDIVLSVFNGTPSLENNSPDITSVCTE